MLPVGSQTPAVVTVSKSGQTYGSTATHQMDSWPTRLDAKSVTCAWVYMACVYMQ